MRFRREAEVTARLAHPGICPVYDAGFAAGVPYLVMRYLDGRSLAAALPTLTPRGSTALFGGWAEGAAQVKAGHVAGGLNRVLLLSDGLANVGELHVVKQVADRRLVTVRAAVGAAVD